MLTLHTRIAPAADTVIGAQLVLPYELREKCRLRARLSNGEEVAVFTARGTLLRGGDLLTGAGALVVQVVAAAEPIYLVRCSDAHTLLRCAFHLGNRHTQAELGVDFLRIRRDPVLAEMLRGLGASVQEEDAAFEPEAGAYGGGHAHGADALAPLALRPRIHRPSDPA